MLAATVLAAVAVGLGAAALSSGLVGSQGGSPNPAVDFSRITPSPYYVTTPTFPDYSNPAHCQLPDNERKRPDLPPLSCRYSSAEPTPGTIPTLSPLVTRPSIPAPSGFQIIDNQLFRFTVQAPDTWYSDMRPEGGAFHLYDPNATREAATQTRIPGGGIAFYFGAGQYVPPRVPDGFLGVVETKLLQPNTSFGGVPGVVWDEGAGEGVAHQYTAAFLKDGIVYRVDVRVQDDRPSAAMQGDIDAVNAVLSTINPY